MSDREREKLLSGELWRDFCDELKQVGDVVLSHTAPSDELTRVEGFRYLTRLLRLSLEKHIEYADPQFPAFYSLSHETAKIGNDNPDNVYLNCAVDGGRAYRIWGNCGSVAYLSIESKAGSFSGGGDMAPTGHIELSQIQRDDDGNFELIVSAGTHPGNWLPMTRETDNLLVRQTFRDRRRERPAQLHIECLDPVGRDTLSAEVFARRLYSVVPFVSGTAELFSQWMDRFRTHINQLPPNDQDMCLRAGGDPSIFYHNSYWSLAPDEALIIRFDPPRCRAWNFQLSSYWMESLDYRHHRISINDHDAVSGRDGSVTIVVASRDPGHDNWLTTADHVCGAMLLRYVEAETFPPAYTRVVTLDELAGELNHA